MLFVLFKTKERDRLGKKTSFVVRGRVVTPDEMAEYFQRTKEDLNQVPLESSSTPPHISYRSPSPAAASDGTAVDEGNEASAIVPWKLEPRASSPFDAQIYQALTTRSFPDGSVLSYMVSQFTFSYPAICHGIHFHNIISQIVISEVFEPEQADLYFIASRRRP